MKALTTQDLTKQLSLLLNEHINMQCLVDDLDEQIEKMKPLLFTELDNGGHNFWLEREAIQALLEPKIKTQLKDSTASFQDLSKRTLQTWLNQFMQWQLPRLALIVLAALSELSEPTWVSVQRGRIMQQLGDFSQAKEFYQQALEENPNNAHAYFHLGYLSLLAKQAEQAVEAFDECLSIDPSYVGANLNKGYCLQKMDRFDEAINSLKQELIISPSMVPAYLTLANCLIESKSLEEAIRTCDQLLNLEPNNINGLKLLITAAINSNDSRLACDSIERCMRLGYQDLDMIELYIGALFKLERWQDVLTYTPQIRQIEPDEAHYIEYEFVASYRLEQWERAHQAYLSLVALWPGAKMTYKEEYLHISSQLIPITTIESV